MGQVSFGETHFVINSETAGLERLIPYLNSWQWKKIIQGAKFESQFMNFYHGVNMHNIWDTMLAEKLAEPAQFTTSLEALADRYLGRKLNKDVRKSFYGGGQMGSDFTEKQLQYAADDVEVLFPIMEAQKKKIESLGQMHIAELEFELSPVIGHMEMVGIPVNVAKWKVVLEKYRLQHELSRVRMNELLYDDGSHDEQIGMFVRDGGINLGSPLQVKKAFEDIGIDLKNTSDQVISAINHPLARELTIYRGLDKAIKSYGGTYLDAIHPFTGRIHPNFQQIGADTGRFSCREPNVQQIPEEYRVCIGDVSEFSIVGADYSQMELRVIAELSEDEKLVEAFNTGVDVHKSTAAFMFGIPLDSVTKEQRFVAKTINFGIAYGMGVKKLRDTVNKEQPKKKISVQDAYFLLEKHRKAYKKVKVWLDAAGEKAYKTGISDTMYGRKRYYTRPDRSTLSQEDFDNQVASIKRKGANTPIQGTNADITKLAMIEVHNELTSYNMKADLINQVHDELVLLVHNSQVEEVRHLVEGAMVRAAEQVLKKVPVKVDSYAGEVWKK